MRFFLTTLIILLLVSSIPLAPAESAPAPTLDQRVAKVMASLSSEERVGQLMLVTFEGSYLDPQSSVATLINDYNIGGVILLASNDNINGQINTPERVQSLAADLQRTAYNAAEATHDRAIPRAFVPMFIATTHSGNGQPETQIALNTTPLPSYMALGATWDPEAARLTGQIAGSELHAMGVNMLLGPSLNVWQANTALGVNSFGGHPYWVGRMAQSYITGVHEGSEGGIAVIAQDFPGLGFADTDPDQEIPVVPRSVDELHDFDLVPFYAVTGNAGNTTARADGIQCANIRYQGESARSTTRASCLDEQAETQLLTLDYFRGWRQRGIVLSSPLGTSAIRRYYDEEPFPHRQVAREAFLAGNDMLYMANFGPNEGDDQFENVVDVIGFFAERYENDPVFRARVDQSLSRILRLKLSLYNGDISYENVRTLDDLTRVGTSTASFYAVAQDSVTLIAPSRDSLVPPPDRSDNIVIFTDVRLVQQCSYCAAYPQVSVNSLEVAIERIYGPYAGALINPEQVVSFSFDQLEAYLGLVDESPDSAHFRSNQRIAESLREADWIVFVMLDDSPTVESSDMPRHFLDLEPGIVERTSLVGIVLGVPSYLSATEISKFSAYYGLFSSTTPYIDAAARALFQESSFTGALPISLPAAGYDIFDATRPDPAQTINLEIDSLAGRTPSTAMSGDTLMLRMGERVVLRTLPIVDKNGHQVPDNTSVEFTLSFEDENLQTRQYGITRDGIAYTSFTPTHEDRVQITAASGDATHAAAFQIVVVDDALAETGASPSTPTPETAAAPATDKTETSPLDSYDFALTLFGLALMGVLGFFAGESSTFTVHGGIRVVLGSAIAGLLGYIYYGLGGPGAQTLYQRLNALAPMLFALLPGLLGLIVTWWTLRNYRRS